MMAQKEITWKIQMMAQILSLHKLQEEQVTNCGLGVMKLKTACNVAVIECAMRKNISDDTWENHSNDKSPSSFCSFL
jgi:hypothetical protein